MESSDGSNRLSMQPLGLSAAQEQIYRALLPRPGSTTEALSQLLRLTVPNVVSLLDSLDKRGLVRRHDRSGWSATSPEVAVNLLLMERQVELNEARRVLPELQAELARDSALGSTVDVQVLAGNSDQQLRAYLSLLEEAQSSVCVLFRPPFLVAAPEMMEAARDAARKRGVRFKSILSPELMAYDGWDAATLQATEAGDELRILDGLPFKLILADGRRAMLPLYVDAQEGAALLLGNTAVTQSLNTLFDQLWEEAVPVHGQPELGDDGADGEQASRELLTVLAAGTNDKTAAHILGVSERTLQRRIASLMLRLRAKSRFQAGVLAAKRYGI